MIQTSKQTTYKDGRVRWRSYAF